MSTERRGQSQSSDVQSDILQLKERVRELEDQLEVLKATVGMSKVIVLRSVTKEQAKREIQDLFDTGETLYYSDVARRLDLELDLVVALCNELVQEGYIGTDGNDVV